MKKYIYLFALLLHAAHLFAQGEFIIEIDPTTGTFVKKGGPIQGITWINPEVRAYDEVNGRMIFPGGETTVDHLFTVNVSDGSIVHSSPYPNALREPQFDNTTGILYGLHWDLTAGFHLVSIDPSTGTHSQVGTQPIAGLGGTYQGMDTYDEIHHWYIIYAPGGLYAIDVQTGNVVSNVALQGVEPGDDLINMSFNNDDATLYGLLREDNTNFFLVTINVMTGAVIKIGGSTILGAGNGSATIDAANRRYIYQYYDNAKDHIAVMSLNSGVVLYNNEIILDENLDNVYSLEYDNVRHKLFSIHWDNQSTTGIPAVAGERADIYPNPATDQLSIRLAKNYQNVHVIMCNAIGQEVRSYDFEHASECVLKTHDLSAGVYFVKIETEGGSFVGRFVRE